MNNYEFENNIDTDNYTSCCGLDIMHDFPYDYADPLVEHCNKHDEYHCTKCDPAIITPKDIIPMIKALLSTNALTAVTNDKQAKAAAALVANGFKVVSTFKGNGGSNLTLWLRQRPGTKKPRKK